jgi:hypothetical protein
LVSPWGGFFPQVDSSLQLNPTAGGQGSDLDFESNLGLDDQLSLPWVSGYWRVGRRHNLEFEWARFDRNGAIGADRQFEIGDTIAEIGAQIDTQLDFDLFRLTYGYSVVRSDRADLQLQFGVHVAEISANLSLTGMLTIPGQGTIDTTIPVAESGQKTAPLPHFGASFAYAFTPKLAASFNFIGLELELDELDGRIIESGVNLEYAFSQRFSLAGGWRYFDVDVSDKKDPDLNGAFEFRYTGPVVYGTVRF